VRRSPARGKWAEERAFEFLARTRGCRLLARNVRFAGGEIDLVVREGDVDVFVEVKARREGNASAAASVSPDKLRRLSRAAAGWVQRRGIPRGGCRFDVVTIGGSGADVRLEHIAGAFEAPHSWNV
jgi:putative endonuclease